ncbi:MAG: hypothetical protein IKQ41_00160 [Clostridia bacterium]|nr:hypothetical protein [Clostridia bacterium]
MKRAAIAIGSNSTRMLAADVRDQALWSIVRGREETRLFLGLDADGSIRPERLEQTAQAVCRLYRQAVDWGAQDVALLATSATRDAKNGKALGERIFALCGLTLRVISGEEEARLAFLAASQGRRRLVMDIGGGSTEWTLGENNRVEWAVSMQLGASRLLKRRKIENEADAEACLALAREIMAPNAEKLRALPPAPVLVGLGGSCTTAASLFLRRQVHGEEAEGIEVSLTEAKRQLALLAPMTLEERMRVPGLLPTRAAHYPHGLCILIAALETLGFDSLTVSGRSNLDGYLLSQTE